MYLHLVHRSTQSILDMHHKTVVHEITRTIVLGHMAEVAIAVSPLNSKVLSSSHVASPHTHTTPHDDGYA